MMIPFIRGRRRAVAICAIWAASIPGVAFADGRLYLAAPGEVEVGSPFVIEIRYDHDVDAPGDQLPTDGLFSAATMAWFDAAGIVVADTDAVTLPGLLDGDGFGGEPDKLVEAGRAGGAGVIAFTAPTGHEDPVVLTITATAVAGGSWSVDPSFYYEPPAANLVAYDATVLDDDVVALDGVTIAASPPPSPRIETFARPAGGRLRITVADAGADPGALSLEQQTPPSSWSTVAGAAFSSLGEDRAETAFDEPRGAERLYRVRID